MIYGSIWQLDMDDDGNEGKCTQCSGRSHTDSPHQGKKETIAHYLLHCPAFDEPRQKLLEVIELKFGEHMDITDRWEGYGDGVQVKQLLYPIEEQYPRAAHQRFNKSSVLHELRALFQTN
eukprot:735395_1